MASPVFFRVAALPVSQLKPFGSAALESSVSRITELQAHLHGLRQNLAAGLYQQIAKIDDPEEKQALLSIKRLCAAGKQLGKADPKLMDACSRTSVAKQLSDLQNAEVELEKLSKDFGTSYEGQHTAECAALHGTFNIPDLLCGVSFSSGSIVDQVLRFQADGSSEPRKRRRMELAWLSYLTRTCLKPSPFSTLTWVGLGMLDDSASVRTAFGNVKKYSMVRIKRYILDQCFQQLLAYQPFLEELKLELNYTLTRIAGDQYSFMVPGKWRPNSSGQYEFKLESMAR